MKRAFAGALLAAVTFAAACGDYSKDTTYPTSPGSDTTYVTYSRALAPQPARSADVSFDR